MGGRLRLDAHSTGHLVGSKNLTGVPVRKFLAALVLGLPAAVAAHFLTFGGGHTVGGASHVLLMDSIVVVLCASILALCAAAVFFALGTREGSIVAARLEGLLPSALSLAVVATGWFILIERAEEPHAIPLAIATFAVVCVALLLRLALGGALRLLAAVALRLLTVPFAATPRDGFDSFASIAPILKRPQLALSRYSRPPPRFS